MSVFECLGCGGLFKAGDPTHECEPDMIKIQNSELKFEKIFHGVCMGIGLHRREPVDDYPDHGDHVMFKFLVEDDECWYVTMTAGSSSSWIEEHSKVVAQAIAWIHANCEPDTYPPHGHQYGWKFKS